MKKKSVVVTVLAMLIGVVNAQAQNKSTAAAVDIVDFALNLAPPISKDHSIGPSTGEYILQGHGAQRCSLRIQTQKNQQAPYDTRVVFELSFEDPDYPEYPSVEIKPTLAVGPDGKNIPFDSYMGDDTTMTDTSIAFSTISSNGYSPGAYGDIENTRVEVTLNKGRIKSFTGWHIDISSPTIECSF